MKNKLLSIMAAFSILSISIAMIFFLSDNTEKSEEIISEQIIALNEIQKLSELGQTEAVSEKISLLQESISTSELLVSNHKQLILICSINFVVMLLFLGYIYFKILRPFDKMKIFTNEIAKGNFDLPLNYERTDYFGDFTWAFDSMRREVTKARSCEKEAIENNKTVIATLSHDIKTPIASIRAYSEGLEANLDTTAEKRKKYISVIIRKCDEVAKLTNDLFIHSLSDLDKLKISSEKVEICSFIRDIISELSVERNDINFTLPVFSAIVSADKNRLIQIAENLINNSRKYAKTKIDISLTRENGNILIHFHDYGRGIPDEDMPFIFDKFYRGKNCGDEQGSGLGLYIVKYLTEQMKGTFLLHNHSNGLEAVILLPEIVEK